MSTRTQFYLGILIGVLLAGLAFKVHLYQFHNPERGSPVQSLDGCQPITPQQYTAKRYIRT